MRKVIVQTEVSLDAVMDHPDLWANIFDYHNDEMDAIYFKGQIMRTDALVMGRVTYESFAQIWPTRAGDEIADRINILPKYVASRTLKEPLTWHATLIKGAVLDEVARLKEQPGQDIVQYGIGELTHTLLQHGLIDELRLLVYPIVIGKGKRAFDGIDTTKLRLLDTKTFSTGAVALHYHPQRPE